MWSRTVVPSAPERTWTRSQTWFAIQKPRPRAPSRAGRRRSASRSSSRPTSAISQTTARAGGPDRLADAAQGHVRRVRAHELLPGGDDPRRVRADPLHVGEPHRLRVRAELLPEPVDLRLRDDHERGLALLHALADERSD